MVQHLNTICIGCKVEAWDWTDGILMENKIDIANK